MKALFLLTILVITLVSPSITHSEDLEQELQQTTNDLQNATESKVHTESEIENLRQLKSQYQNALNNLNYSLSSNSNLLIQTNTDIDQKEREITQIITDIEVFQTELKNKNDYVKTLIRDLYVNQKIQGITTTVLTTDQNTTLSQLSLYHHNFVDTLRTTIISLTQQVEELNSVKNLAQEIRETLEIEKAQLESANAYIQQEITTTQSNINYAESQQQNLEQTLIGINNEITNLSQKQKDILARKAAAALKSTSVGNVEITEKSIEKDPPNDGNVYFSFWTYGYPHRVGLSQYGALGRAFAGQNTETILKAYYNGVEIQDWEAPTNITISTTQGNQSLHFEDEYLLGIGEMPSCWGEPHRGGLEVLKTQAIISRTYALKYTDNGKNAICTDQRCQVYVGPSKVAGLCGNLWKEAVESTKGQVLTHNGELISAWYSITAGGFTISSEQAWGGYRPYALGIADFDPNGVPYESAQYAGSPWYYKAWGSDPWLSFDEVTTLLNAALLPESYNSQLENLTSEEIVAELNNLNIQPVANLTSLEVIDENGNSGANTASTKYVRGYFNNGSEFAEIPGSRFKFIYNLRSPGTNAIWTSRFDIMTAANL